VNALIGTGLGTKKRQACLWNTDATRTLRLERLFMSSDFSLYRLRDPFEAGWRQRHWKATVLTINKSG